MPGSDGTILAGSRELPRAGETTNGRYGQPPRTYVVMEARIWGRNVWAWCEVNGDGPGFTDITYTEADGISIVDAPGIQHQLGRFLFTVTA